MNQANRYLGGILLVAGTSTGAGMLALPVLTCFAGFIPALIAFIACWLFMLATAYLILEVNLDCRGDVNMVSMAARTLGLTGKVVCWTVYLLLLYSLTAAYIAGSSPLFLAGIGAITGVALPAWVGPFPLLLFFGLFVYLGTQKVDYLNRFLMIFLIAAYSFLVVSLPSHVKTDYLTVMDGSAIWLAVPVILTSFGFHIIIPTLTTYLNHSAKRLRWIMFIGSVIPLIIYLVWELLIIGVLPWANLASAWKLGVSAAVPLAQYIDNPWIATAANFFSFFAIITSFLGVSLSLSDFLGDGLKLHRFTWGREIACLLTFIPPLVFVLAYQRGFMIALQYAGLFVAILLGLMPPLMAWKLKKFKHPLKKAGLVAVILISIGLIGLCVCSN
jgi:tyrosine-specific transport protein